MSRKIQTYPNQKVVHINKPNYTGDFLSIGNNEWIKASNDLKPNTFRLYLYLAGNANGFDLALSRQDVMNTLSVSKNTYIGAVEELMEKKYIIEKKGNVYDFYTTPRVTVSENDTTDDDETDSEEDTDDEDDMYQSDGMYHSSGTVCTSTVVHDVPTERYSMYQSTGTEINKKNKNLSINKDADAKKEEEDLREYLESLDDKVLYGINDDYKKHMKYMEIKNKYNLKPLVTPKLIDMVQSIIYQKEQRKAIENAVIPEYMYSEHKPAEYKPRTDRKKLSKEMQDLW